MEGLFPGHTMSKEILILFPDEWLSHSPTILNLARSLEEVCAVKVITFDDGTFDNESLEGGPYSFIRINRALARLLLRRVRFMYGLIKSMLLLKAVRDFRRWNEPAQVIAVDSIGLWVAQRVFGRAHFLSLETKKDFFMRWCNRENILSLVIQSEERARFLFGDTRPRTFFIQNAPALPRDRLHTVEEKPFDGRLIFLGNIVPEHGIFSCLDAVEEMAGEGITLTIKGVLYRNRVKQRILRRYGHLLKAGKVTLDQTYVEQDRIIDFLGRFSIGFCLYDFRILSKKDFNYLSSPSGKVFNYYAAGVPVIGTDVPGLFSVKDFNAGVLLPEPSIPGIKRAIRDISGRFDFYRTRCLEAARHFDFAQAVKPYQDFLIRGGSHG